MRITQSRGITKLTEKQIHNIADIRTILFTLAMHYFVLQHHKKIIFAGFSAVVVIYRGISKNQNFSNRPKGCQCSI